MLHTIKNGFWAVRVRLGVYFYAAFDAFLAAIYSFANKADNSFFRRARFDSMSKRQDFLLVDRGRERFAVIASDVALSKPLFVYGNQEFDKFEKALSLLKGESFNVETLIEVGANIGTICVTAVNRGYVSRALAIEPEPKNYRALVSNIYLNNLADKITPFNLALGNTKDQRLTLELSPNNSGDHRIKIDAEKETGAEGARQTVVVRSDTLDSVVPNIDKASLIWMDTQGYEGLILNGAQRATGARVPMVVEFWPGGMKRVGAYEPLRAALINYSRYYDLSDKKPMPVAMSGLSLDRLYQTLEGRGHGAFTDILVV